MQAIYLTMLGWWCWSICLRRPISLSVDMGTPSSVSGTRTFFRATNLPGLCRSRAFHTVPYAPATNDTERSKWAVPVPGKTVAPTSNGPAAPRLSLFASTGPCRFSHRKETKPRLRWLRGASGAIFFLAYNTNNFQSGNLQPTERCKSGGANFCLTHFNINL